MRKGIPAASALILAAALAFTVRWMPGWYWSLRTDNPVRRGARIAAREGCLSCHGPMGRDEPSNPGSRWGAVPSFFRGNAMMYVKSPSQITAFIADGTPEGKRPSDPGGFLRSARSTASPPFHMRGFGGRLGGRQLSDLTAFVLAADGYLVPAEGPASKGSELSAKFGCEGCHGVGGSGGAANPRSFTGTVPGWIGPDFDHLVSGEAEFKEWVLKGRSERWASNRAASFFLDRANLYMPSYRSALSEDDVAALWAYVQWLRSSPVAQGASATAP